MVGLSKCLHNETWKAFPFQVSVTNLGSTSGATIVITKPGTPPVTPRTGTGKTVVATSGAIAQLIQTAPGSHGKQDICTGACFSSQCQWRV